MDKDSKKELMFERMREKKKEVKMVRRIVLAITLTCTYDWFIRRKICLSICDKWIATTRSRNQKRVIEVEIPIGSGLEFNCGET